MKRLVVVESPTKAKTIRNFLPKGSYQVEACYGHVRDLPASASEIPKQVKAEPWARLGVNVKGQYEPLYVVPSSKKNVVKSLKAALKGADELFIATDEDREGESIGWHLLEVLKPRVPIRRMVFHEITAEAIEEALNHTRSIDQRLVDAQETRRVLDRLVGYTISPVLWRKIAPKLSAGRVQSVAVRLLVMREKERIAFVPASYWDLKAALHKDQPFEAQMTHLDGVRLATGRDFDETTGRLYPDREVVQLGEERAKTLADALPGTPWKVVNVEERAEKRRPYPPFITSTLQQEANRKLGLSARDTMRTAQNLYEQGLITYMRTDSTHLSNEAIDATRSAVLHRYGKPYLSPSPRRFGQNAKSAQEAHEAIRPSGRKMQTAEELRLSGVERKVYDLIWKRTVASQMADARLTFTTATLEAGDAETGTATFRASGKRIDFPGFFRAYVEGHDDPDAALEDRDDPLPPLKKHDQPACKGVEALGHETKPPARYTEASLVKRLEDEGIGRPSTYATIISTIIDRGYVFQQGNRLIPTFTAFATNKLLESQFNDLVDIGFTADMEQVLDDIAEGKADPLPYLKSLYAGDQGLEHLAEEGLDAIDARAVSTIAFPKWDPYVVRVGKFGPYVAGALNGDEVTAPIPDDTAPDELSASFLKQLLEDKNSDDLVIGIHPEADQPILAKKGPYGPYLQLGDDDQEGKPKRISLPKGLELHDVDLEQAVQLLSLPRSLGSHPETGNTVKANIGRYGPYVQHTQTFASLKDTDDVVTITLDRALELLRAKTKKNEPLRTLGKHPETQEPVDLYDGRYGPYVKHERLNASLPKNVDADQITLDEALALLKAKAESKGKGKGRKRRAKSKAS